MSAEPTVNILMVDDEPKNLIALEATLESLKQNLIKASSGKEALRQLLENDFALILLDVQMPELSGIETAVLIRERERSRHVPIIFLTGAVKTEEMMFKGYTAGAVDYLMKPLVPEILRAKAEVFIELALSRKRLQIEMIEQARIAAEISQLNFTLKQTNEDLLAANADLEAFGHSASHDLRAPLRYIQSYIDLLEKSAYKKLSDTERDHMGVIRKSAARMGNLIDALLAFSRIGQAEMLKTKVDMDSLAREIQNELKPVNRERNIVWEISPLPEVWGDYHLLRQVWSNLLDNAVKYTRPRDPAKIEVGASYQGSEIVFHVKDNGVGFNMDFSDKLFAVFSRLHDEKDFEGTGVGLANVRRIVQRHGGNIWTESKEGEGTTFYFSLPKNIRS